MTYKSYLIFLTLISVSVSIYFINENFNYYNTSHSDTENHDESIHLIEEAEKDSLNSVLQLQAARLLQSQNEFQNALIFYRRYERHETLNSEISAEIGLLLWTLRPNVESVKYFSKSLAMDSINPGGLMGMGIATASIGESEKALLYFDKLLKYHANSEFAKVAEQWKIDLNKKRQMEE
ncbi:MAG: hypothetical protein KDD94_03605 [Calditrichaeota bacterium]|nr:hypothetical protein [Calditrichota bacterium]